MAWVLSVQSDDSMWNTTLMLSVQAKIWGQATDSLTHYVCISQIKLFICCQFYIFVAIENFSSELSHAMQHVLYIRVWGWSGKLHTALLRRAAISLHMRQIQYSLGHCLNIVSTASLYFRLRHAAHAHTSLSCACVHMQEQTESTCVSLSYNTMHTPTYRMTTPSKDLWLT